VKLHPRKADYFNAPTPHWLVRSPEDSGNRRIPLPPEQIETTAEKKLPPEIRTYRHKGEERLKEQRKKEIRRRKGASDAGTTRRRS